LGQCTRIDHVPLDLDRPPHSARYLKRYKTVLIFVRYSTLPDPATTTRKNTDELRPPKRLTVCRLCRDSELLSNPSLQNIWVRVYSQWRALGTVSFDRRNL